MNVFPKYALSTYFKSFPTIADQGMINIFNLFNPFNPLTLDHVLYLLSNEGC